jgi:methionyl aminopeptidase
VQQYAESQGFSVVRDYVGHGVGKDMHESPQIPNFGKPGKGPRLQEGMVLAIEPMVNAGVYNVKVVDNGWTVVTVDGKPSAHYENTVAVTDGEPELLTVL